MKNFDTSKLFSQEFSEVLPEQSTPDEIEDKVITAHLNQIKNDFLDERTIVKTLIKVFSEEKHEAEKNADYETRLRRDVDEVLK